MAQTSPARRFVRARGQATVTSKPDQASVDIGVTTQGQTAQTVAAENASRLDSVLKQLRAKLGQQAEIKTISYSLTPAYQYPKDGSPPKLTGYTAQNTVRITTGNLSSVGEIIDLATRSGANRIETLQFTLKNEQRVRSEALRQAAMAAKLNAEAIAAGLGLKVVRVISAEEGAPETIQPVHAMALPRTQFGAVQPPVEPGPIETHATVVLDMEIQ